MADISKIKLVDNTEYNIKDANAIHQVKTINNQSIVGSGNIDVAGDDTTYSLSILGNVITLSGSDSTTSNITLPIYDGGVIDGTPEDDLDDGGSGS